MKRSIWKTVLTVLLLSGLAVGICAGCGETATPTTTTIVQTSSANLNPPGTLPVCKEVEPIRVVITEHPQFIQSYEYGENKFTTWLQDRTNVAVDFILFPETDTREKLTAELSSGGDLGDLILIQMDRAMLVTYGRSGALAPLNDLIERYGFAMKECLDAFDGSRQAITAPDGNIYALPQGNLIGIVPNAYAQRFWIQNNFLAKYTTTTGKKMPTTTDEMYEYMKWCVNSDPNGNGKADEVGWTGAEKTSVWYARPTCFLMNAFTLQNQDGYYQKDDAIHCAMVEEGYRSGLKYLAKLMDEGLMDPNYPSNDENAIKTLVALEGGSSVAGGNIVATISCGGMHNAATDHKIRNMYTIVAPLKGPTGLQNAFYDHYAAGVLPGKATIPMASDKKDIVMAWMDTMYDQEVYNRSHYGEPGVDWEIPPAGTLAADGGPATYRKIPNMSSVPIYSHWYTSGPAMWNRNGNYTVPKVPNTDANGNPIHDLEGTLYNASRLYEDYVIPCSVPTFFFDLKTAAKVDGWKSAIDTYCRTAITDYILGRRGVNDDADWAAYVAGARALGLDDYLKVMQDNYDANWKGTLPDVYEKKPFRMA